MSPLGNGIGQHHGASQSHNCGLVSPSKDLWLWDGFLLLETFNVGIREFSSIETKSCHTNTRVVYVIGCTKCTQTPKIIPYPGIRYTLLEKNFSVNRVNPHFYPKPELRSCCLTSFSFFQGSFPRFQKQSPKTRKQFWEREVRSPV